MANRVLQQKRMKMKRMRRAWAKPFSRKNTGPIQQPVYINDKNDPVSISIKDRSKAAGSGVRHLDSLSESLRRRFRFKETDAESIYMRHAGLHTDLTRDGELVLARMFHSRRGAGTIQGEVRFVYSVLYKDANRERRLYMGGEACFFVEERISNSGGSQTFLSAEYPSKEWAMQAHLDEKVLWIETISPPADQ